MTATTPRRPTDEGVVKACLVTIAAVLPGLGHLLAGRRRTGLVLVSAAPAALASIVLALDQLTVHQVAYFALRPGALLAAAAALLVIGLAWCVSIRSAHRAALPPLLSRRQVAISRAVVWTVCLAVMAPLTWGAHQAYAVHSALAVLAAPGDAPPPTDLPTSPPAETIEPAPAEPPQRQLFGGRSRVNLLLLGGDGAKGRPGTRADTIVVVSIDATSGRTALISLPRNLQNIPLRPGTKLAAAYPRGFKDFWFGLYTAAEARPSLMPKVAAKQAGAAAMADTAGYLTGLAIEHWAVVNLAGFAQIVEDLGGVTLEVRSGNGKAIPIGGSMNADGSTKRAPHGYIPLGKHKLTGHQALWYSRSRFGASDHERQARQRCLLTAMARQIEPSSVLSAVNRFTAAARQILLTNITGATLGDILELAGKQARKATIDRITVLDVIGSSNKPNVSAIRARAKAAVAGKAPPAAHRDHGVAREMC